MRDQQQHKHPLWRGVLLAPLAAPICFLLVGFCYVLATQGLRGLGDWPAGIAFALVFGLPLSYAAMLILGLPFVLWLRSIQQLKAIFVCIGSVLAGAISMPTFIAILGNNPSQPIVRNCLIGAGLGLASGIAFCVAVRPNNSFKPTPLRGVGKAS